MEENDKVYGKCIVSYPLSVTWLTRQTGFTISLFEWQPTIPTLWDAVKGACDYALFWKPTYSRRVYL